MAVDGDTDESSRPPVGQRAENPPAASDSQSIKEGESSFGDATRGKLSTGFRRSRRSTRQPITTSIQEGALGSEIRSSVSDSHTASFDDSTHSSSSSVRELRDNILLQNPRVPPAFRNVDPSPSPSPKGRRSFLSEHHNSQKRKSRRPPIGRPSIALPAETDEGASNFFPTVSHPPLSHPPLSNPPRPPSRSFSNERKSKASDQEAASGLRVSFINIDSLAGDKSNVSTYNAMLESIVNSDTPEVQKGLDMLATMQQNGVAPDETTWELLDRCCRLRNEPDAEEELDESLGSRRITWSGSAHADAESSHGMLKTPIQKFSLYASERQAGKIEHEKNPQKRWRMEQDLSLLPPAFRTSILAMLRRKSYGDAPETKESATPALKPPPETLVRPPSEDTAIREVVPSVSDRRKLFLSNDRTVTERIKSEDDRTPFNPSEPSLAPALSDDSAKEQDFYKRFAEHGEVQYLRPDGLGKSALRKPIPVDSGNKDDDDSAGFLHALEGIENSIPAFRKLLFSIAGSGLPDSANLAGKVLKRMKSNSLTIDEKTLELLEACTRLPEAPNEPKPHEVEMVDEIVVQPENAEENTFSTPTQLITKRVRFSDNNSFRFIRRRRSIGSNERWDDPLTPPKRVTEPVDLAPGRFSSGLRDDRPALPRRTLSLHSASSHSECSSSTSTNDTLDSSFDEEFSGADKFKLPFADSPEATEKKIPARKSVPGSNDKPSRGLSGSTATIPSTTRDQRRGSGVPTAPVRSSSNDNAIFFSPPVPSSNTLSASSLAEIPPPPLDDPSIYRTPSPQRRNLRRRSSISGIERRAFMPLTPPRRVSAPLELFIAQEALMAKQRKALAAIVESKKESPRFDQSDLAKEVGSITIGPIATSTTTTEGSMEVKASHGRAQVARPDSHKPLHPTPHIKANRRSIDLVPNTYNPTRQATTSAKSKTFQVASETGVAHTESRSISGLTDSKDIISALMRHDQRMSEHWKRMEFNESYNDDASISGRWNTVDIYKEEAIQPPAEEGYGLRSTPSHDGSPSSQNRRIRPRQSRRATSSTIKPNSKHAESPSWQRVLSGSGQVASGRKSRRTPDRPGSASLHGMRTILIDEDDKDESKDKIDAGQKNHHNILSEKSNESRATRRNSLPG